MVRSFDLKSGDDEFKSSSDHYLDLSKQVPQFASCTCNCIKQTGLPLASWDP